MLVAPKEKLNIEGVKAKLNQHFEKHTDVEMQNVFVYYSKDRSIEMETRLQENGIEDVSFIAYVNQY